MNKTLVKAYKELQTIGLTLVAYPTDKNCESAQFDVFDQNARFLGAGDVTGDFIRFMPTEAFSSMAEQLECFNSD